MSKGIGGTEGKVDAGAGWLDLVARQWGIRPDCRSSGPLEPLFKGREFGRARQRERLSWMRTSEVVPGDALLTQALARPTFKEVTRQ
jgi:hypothetical protein